MLGTKYLVIMSYLNYRFHLFINNSSATGIFLSVSHLPHNIVSANSYPYVDGEKVSNKQSSTHYIIQALGAKCNRKNSELGKGG